FVSRVSTTKIKCVKAVLAAPPDGAPDDQVVWAQFPELLTRGAVLVGDRCMPGKEDGSSNRDPVPVGQQDEPAPGRKDSLPQKLEVPARLDRHAETTARV